VQIWAKGLKIGVEIDEKYNYITLSHINTDNVETGMKETLPSYIV
jgi:hypothetical protein